MRRRDTTVHLSLLGGLSVLGVVLVRLASPAHAEPAATQPVLPSSAVVDGMIDRSQPPLEVHKPALHRPVVRFHTARRQQVPRDLDRPALSGVMLVAPLPPPGEPPHIAVPVPAYPFDTLAADVTTPPPPIVCHHVRRDPNAPDPHLYREATVACEPDTP